MKHHTTRSQKALDLDEIKASPAAERKLPWWIKEVDKPTVEIDWSQMKRFDSSNIMFLNGFAQAVGPDNAMKMGGRAAETGQKNILKKKPGFTLREKALVTAGWLTSLLTAEHSFLGPGLPVPPAMSGIPDDFDCPRYEGTPEENTRMVRAAAKLFGAASVGVVELDENTRKLFYAFDGWDGRRWEFEDVDKAYQTKKKKVIPYKARWVIVYTIRMSLPSLATAPTALSTAASSIAYSEGTSVQLRLQQFINSLGYQCLADGNMGTSGNSPGFAILAGLGELSRLNRMISPRWGPMVRVFKVITDLPLAPTKPIDAGIFRFCRICKKCAELCPSNALSMETEPSWEIQGAWNNPGVKTYYEKAPNCFSQWLKLGGHDCGICLACCPFSKQDKSFIHMHDMVRQIIATTPAFNGMFRKLDTDPGYGNDPEAWWELDLPPHGYKNT
ncbi:MAG TPA: reductive dehalogenase [Dehalococcoidia bacterium]|nr:reductive dehalogenase [Dehalococcoidia bacterium]